MIVGAALVTGAGSGIGRAVATALARRGVSVHFADRDHDAAERAAREAGGRAVALDVTDGAAFADVVARVDRDEGLAYLVNNAGIAVGGEAELLEDEDWRRVLAVNLDGTIHGVRAAYPKMLARGRGHIVNVASIAGLTPFPFALPYTTSKHAVVGLSLALRAEGAARGVRVSVACPGTIDTPIWDRSPVRGFDRASVLRYLGPRTSAEACARAILKGVDRNRAVIVVGPDARAHWFLQRTAPNLAGWLREKLVAWGRTKFRNGKGGPTK